MSTSNPKKSGFTLVELLVVIGIIAVLIGLILPSLQKAQAQARWVNCQSNMRDVGVQLQAYANANRGWIYPPRRGASKPPEERWPMFVFKPAQWNPKILKCPSDAEIVENDHSYILNNHLYQKGIKYGSKVPNRTPSDVVVMGEKRWDYPDYYMDPPDKPDSPGDYYTRVDLYKHGRKGSNYLFLDGHVGTLSDKEAVPGLDPWDFPDPVDPTSKPAAP
jgi:prepilin-type N-terminal cleavage/methylation domain-containing protein/prepilin-type processing-associated H-X9-DG protein